LRGDYFSYMQEHDPFNYFDPIRLNAARCESSIVPVTQLDRDLSDGMLPNFLFIPAVPRRSLT
jgi:hypothetical protein